MTDVIHKVILPFDAAKAVSSLSVAGGVPLDFEETLFDFYLHGSVGNRFTRLFAKHVNFEVNGIVARFSGSDKEGFSLLAGREILPVSYTVLTGYVMFHKGKGRHSHQKNPESLIAQLAAVDYCIVCDVWRLADSKVPRLVWYQIPSELLHSLAKSGLLTKDGWGRRRFFRYIKTWNLQHERPRT